MHFTMIMLNDLMIMQTPAVVFLSVHINCCPLANLTLQVNTFIGILVCLFNVCMFVLSYILRTFYAFNETG